MSTRATYAFQIGGRPAVTVYIHHDGYPNGAAFYFWNAHHNAGKCGHPLTRFLRANEGAEITGDHETHGDTEYRYTLRDDQLTAHKRRFDGDTPRWHVFFAGPLVEFINQYGAEARSFWAAEFSPIREVTAGASYWRRKVTMSRKQITERVAAEQKKHDEYKAAHPQWTGNIDSLARECVFWADVLKEYDAQGTAPASAVG